MANSISLVTKYLNLMDEVYKMKSLTQPFEVADSDMKNTNEAQTVQIQTLTLDGLSDYNRNTGYTSGDATLAWASYQLQKDRGKRFNLDKMNSKEAMLAIAKLGGAFVREKVVPEVDQYRFAQLYANAGNTNQTATPTAADIYDNLLTGEQTLQDAEVEMDGVILYISPTCYNLLKNSSDISKQFTVQTINNGKINTNIETFDNMRVQIVPSGRFASGVTLGSNGFTQTGYNINWMLVDPKAVFAVRKLDEIKIIDPAVNQTYSGWSFFYRIYHDCFVMGNKADGVYVDYGSAI